MREEESLLGCEPVLLRQGVLRQTVHQRHVPQVDAPVVRGVLAQRQTSVQLHPGNRGEMPVFVGDAVGACVERLRVPGRPPIARVARTVVPPPRVVEAMRQLVADDASFTGSSALAL